MKRGVIAALLAATVAYAECPPEAVPGSCIENLPPELAVVEEEPLPSVENSAHRERLKEGVTALQSGDYSRALTIFKALAEEGNFIAQQNLGLMYNEGLGTARDREKAAHWFEKSDKTRRNTAALAQKSKKCYGSLL